MTVRDELFSSKINLLLPLSILIISFGMIAWNSMAWEGVLKKESALLDTVMQLRFDLTRTHNLLHESSEDLHGGEVSGELRDQVHLLSQRMDQLSSGYLTMGIISETIQENSDISRGAKRLAESFAPLLHDLQADPVEAHRANDGEIRFDAEFYVARTAAEKLDQDIHRDIYQKINRKHEELVYGLITGGIVFGLVFLYLLRANKYIKHSNRKVMQLTQALEHSGEAVIISDSDGMIEYVSPSFTKLTGYAFDEVLGKKTAILKSGKQSNDFYDNLWGTLASGEVWNGKLLNKRKDGSQYWALMTIAPIFDPKGSITHYVANQQDISELLALEAKVSEANKMDAVGTLAAGIAHEFNNDLAIISGNLHLMERMVITRHDMEKYIVRANTACDRAAGQVQQLLGFARRDTVENEIIDLTHCVDRTCGLAQALIPSTIKLDACYPEQDVCVLWMENQLHQVLINLINNAAHALEGVEAPHIDVRVRVAHPEGSDEMAGVPYALIEVSDNGCGIPEELQERIFNPFYTTKEAGEGTGLGLAVVYGIVRRAAGFIRVHSEVGRGTSFRVYVPLCDAE